MSSRVYHQFVICFWFVVVIDRWFDKLPDAAVVVDGVDGWVVVATVVFIRHNSCHSSSSRFMNVVSRTGVADTQPVDTPPSLVIVVDSDIVLVVKVAVSSGVQY